ncbi:MAG TPA: RluA family pseudouridine synthase [Planctomycetota bacterium]|nr:RluA family pseudouridine synthase [Planctomycetota bacterium]
MNDHLVVPGEQAGIELDEFLARTFPLLGKRFLRRQVREGRVLVDGGDCSPSQRLRIDQVVSVDFDEDALDELPVPTPPAVALDVLHEDEHVLVVDKPSDLMVEPDRWDPLRPNLIGALHALAGNLDGDAGRFRPRIVHRLDKDTSGAVLVAKTIEAERELARAFEEGRITKHYLALVEGEHPLADGEREIVDKPLAPDGRRGGTMAVRAEGKPSRTRLAVEQRFRGFTLLRCEPLTGRTHQLRVHLASEGFPLVVDPLYGRRSALALSEIKAGYRAKPGRPELPLIDRLTLHALRVEFDSLAEPGRRVVVEAPLPRDLQRVLKQLAKVRPPRSARST